MADRQTDTTDKLTEEYQKESDFLNFYERDSYYLNFLTEEEKENLKTTYSERWKAAQEDTRTNTLKKKATAYTNLRKEYEEKAKAIYWERIRGDAEKIKAAAQAYIESLSYSLFSFQRLLRGMIFLMAKAYSISYTPTDGVIADETAQAELDKILQDHTDIDITAAEVINERLEEHKKAFIDVQIIYMNREKAAQEWDAFIDAFIEAKVKEWVEKAEEEQEQPKTPTIPFTEILNVLDRPKYFEMQRAKLVNKLEIWSEELLGLEADGNLNFRETEIPGEERRGTITINKAVLICSLTATQSGLSKAWKKLNNLDKRVLNAVCTLYKAGFKVMTLKLIWQTMNGNDTETKLTQKQADKLKEALGKMGTMRMYLDISDEIGHKYLSKEELKTNDLKVTMDENIIMFAGCYVENRKGFKEYAIEVVKAPLTYRYCAAHGQITSVPIYLLNTHAVPSAPKITDESQAIQHYLLGEILQMKPKNPKGYRDNTIITVEDMLIKCDIRKAAEDGNERALTRTEKNRVIDTAIAFLDIYKSKTMQRFIKDYEIMREGKGNRKPIKGFNIIF